MKEQHKSAEWIPWLTLGLVLVMFLIEYMAINQGTRASWNQSFGLIPERPYTYFTHAFLHTSPGHFAGNMTVLVIFGWISEKRINTKLLVGAACSAIAISALTSILWVPAWGWPTDINPAGFSQVVYMFVVIGVFSFYTLAASKIIEIARRFHHPIFRERIRSAILRLEALTPVVGFLLAIATVYWILPGEIMSRHQNYTGTIGHSVGTIVGIILVTAIVLREFHQRRHSESGEPIP